MRGKGGRGRLVELTAAADAALEDWLARHPDARGVGGGRRLPPEDAPLFCTLGRGGHDPGRPLSPGALNQLVTQHAKVAGIAAHLRHPHVLRPYWATRRADLGTPLHRLMELGGWQSLRTLQAYLRVDEADPEADVDRFAAADAYRRALQRSNLRGEPQVGWPGAPLLEPQDLPGAGTVERSGDVAAVPVNELHPYQVGMRLALRDPHDRSDMELVGQFLNRQVYFLAWDGQRIEAEVAGIGALSDELYLARAGHAPALRSASGFQDSRPTAGLTPRA